ncbi:MAG: hypothetical protein ACK4OM_01435 [Alphaproteobacteria bacterium]
MYPDNTILINILQHDNISIDDLGEQLGKLVMTRSSPLELLRVILDNEKSKHLSKTHKDSALYNAILASNHKELKLLLTHENTKDYGIDVLIKGLFKANDRQSAYMLIKPLSKAINAEIWDMYDKVYIALSVSFANLMQSTFTSNSKWKEIANTITSSNVWKGVTNLCKPVIDGALKIFEKPIAHLRPVIDELSNKLPVTAETRIVTQDVIKSSAPVILGLATIKASWTIYKDVRDYRGYRATINDAGYEFSKTIAGGIIISAGVIGGTIAPFIAGCTTLHGVKQIVEVFGPYTKNLVNNVATGLGRQ